MRLRYILWPAVQMIPGVGKVRNYCIKLCERKQNMNPGGINFLRMKGFADADGTSMTNNGDSITCSASCKTFAKIVGIGPDGNS